MMAAKIDQNNNGRLKRLYDTMYPWQRRFVATTLENDSSMLMASNQSGKSRSGCIIDAYHLNGNYPEDWEGLKFDFPPLLWLLGYSGEKTRDLLQKKLFGRLKDGQFEGGYIPADQIVDYIGMSGTSGACREIRVKHKHGVSVCQFWSYSQGQHALMGDIVDWYHIDEEPEDHEIYPQVVTRTLNGNRGKGGAGILTFTPENGKTELVCQFMDNPGEGMYMMGATWDECPHMTEEKKVKFLSRYPAYQRRMRSEGVPLMGTGLVFEHSEDSIRCKRFQIPKHFWIINGMDFGWNHPQAHIQLAIDPDSATLYVTQAWKKSKKQPFEAWDAVKMWAKDVPTSWPSDGQQHKQQSGNRDAVEQKEMYIEQGWEMLDEPATWPDGGNGLGVGLTKLNNLMQSGKFKVFEDLVEVFEEIREYHTKEDSNGIVVIVKVKEDLICAIRYALMMARFAEQKNIIDNHEVEDYQEYNPPNAMGY